MSDVSNKGLRTLDEIRASRAQHGDLDQVANQIVQGEPTWWGVEWDNEASDLSDIFQTISRGINQGLPTPIAITPRPWAAEMIIQVAPSHRDDWRTWWNGYGAGPWAVTQQRHGRYVHHRSHGNYRGWRLVILHVTEDGTDD